MTLSTPPTSLANTLKQFPEVQDSVDHSKTPVTDKKTTNLVIFYIVDKSNNRQVSPWFSTLDEVKQFADLFSFTSYAGYVTRGTEPLVFLTGRAMSKRGLSISSGLPLAGIY